MKTPLALSLFPATPIVPSALMGRMGFRGPSIGCWITPPAAKQGAAARGALPGAGL